MQFQKKLFDEKLIDQMTYDIMKDEIKPDFITNMQTISGEMRNKLTNELIEIAEKYSFGTPGFFQKIWDAITEWLEAAFDFKIEMGRSGQSRMVSFAEQLNQQSWEQNQETGLA